MPRLVSHTDVDTDLFATNQASGASTSGGEPKTYANLDRGAVMTRLQAWLDEGRIRGVEMWLSDGTSQLFGAREGDTSSFTVSRGETLRKLNIQPGGDADDGSPGGLGTVYVETGLSRTWGISAEDLQEDGAYWHPVGSGIVCGMFGDCGPDSVHSLGFAMLNPIRRARLVDVTYPNLDKQAVDSAPIAVASQEYANESAAPQHSTLTGTTSLAVKRSWSVTTGFEETYPVGVLAGIPEVASRSWIPSRARSRNRWELINEDQTWSWPVVCPPNRRIRATGMKYSERIDTEYKGRVHVDLENGHFFEYEVTGIYEGWNVRLC